jgi:hypothetical protein
MEDNLMGATIAEAQAVLDLRFPLTGASDYIAYSTDGATEFTNLARTFVGATGWSAATAADPAVKANANVLTSATVVTSGGTITHFTLFTLASGGVQRLDWQLLDNARALAVGESLQWDVGSCRISLT